MAQSDKVGKFKITVNRDYKIQAEREPKEGDIEDCQISFTNLQWRTVDFLIDMLRGGRLQSRKELELLGENLYAILLDNKIGEALYEAIYNSPPQLKYWRVELEFKAVLYPFVSWPWEYLYCPFSRQGGGAFLAERTNFVLTRRLTTSRRARDLLVPEDQKIRVLFVAPSSEKLPVEYGRVLETLKALEVNSQNRIELTTLVDDPYSPEEDNKYEPQATFSNFFCKVCAIDPHVIHFIGHGKSVNNEGGQLAFLDGREQGKEHWVGEELAPKLAGGTALRLVFLQACESAHPASSYIPYEAISGLAMQIAHQNIPAVVGMQYPINTLVANKFASAFYEALVSFKSIDAAILAGRLEILPEISDWKKSISFGLPVLYLRESGSLIAPQTAQTRTGSTPSAFKKSAPPPPINVPTEELLCHWCGYRCRPKENFCINGHPLICTRCKTRVDSQRDHCSHCGRKLIVEQ